MKENKNQLTENIYSLSVARGKALFLVDYLKENNLSEIAIKAMEESAKEILAVQESLIEINKKG
ncbi:hypothetical protein OAA62_00965 [bacterium]|nr:hypothetical protein [bacterium]